MLINEDIKKLKPVVVEIDQIDFFECEDYDVVKMNINLTKQLKEYRKLFKDKYENTQTYKEYHPHCTLGYVQKGIGKKYKIKLDEPIEITFDEGVYSDYRYKKKYFKLKN